MYLSALREKFKIALNGSWPVVGDDAGGRISVPTAAAVGGIRGIRFPRARVPPESRLPQGQVCEATRLELGEHGHAVGDSSGSWSEQPASTRLVPGDRRGMFISSRCRCVILNPPRSTKSSVTIVALRRSELQKAARILLAVLIFSYVTIAHVWVYSCNAKQFPAYRLLRRGCLRGGTPPCFVRRAEKRITRPR